MIIKSCVVCNSLFEVNTNDKTCGLECKKLNRKQKCSLYQSANKERLRVLRKIWEKENSEHKADYAKKYVLKNIDKIRARKTKYRSTINGRSRVRADEAKRRAPKLQATPKWLTKQHLAEIRQFYKLAQEKIRLEKIKYQVDHIVPLLNPNVCGLHVPWNLQILTATANNTKNNKIP